MNTPSLADCAVSTLAEVRAIGESVGNEHPMRHAALQRTAPAPSNPVMEDAIRDAIAHGIGIVRIDPSSIYQQSEQAAPSKAGEPTVPVPRSLLQLVLEKMEDDWKRIDTEFGPMVEGGLDGDIQRGDAEEIRLVRALLSTHVSSRAGEWTDEQIDALAGEHCPHPIVSAEQMRSFARALLSAPAQQTEAETIRDAAEAMLEVLDGYPEQLVPINRKSATVTRLRAALSAPAQAQSENERDCK